MHGLEGLKHMASSIVPGIYHENELDRKIRIATEDAYEMVYMLGQIEGMLVGQSSGAAMVAALKLARTLREGMSSRSFPTSATNIFPPICGSDGSNGGRNNGENGWKKWSRDPFNNGTYPRTLLPELSARADQGADPLPSGEEVRPHFQYPRRQRLRGDGPGSGRVRRLDAIRSSAQSNGCARPA